MHLDLGGLPSGPVLSFKYCLPTFSWLRGQAFYALTRILQSVSPFHHVFISTTACIDGSGSFSGKSVCQTWSLVFLERGSILGYVSAFGWCWKSWIDLVNALSIAGQNSFRGTGDLAQQRLSYYCDGESFMFGYFQVNVLMETSLDPKIDVWDGIKLRMMSQLTMPLGFWTRISHKNQRPGWRSWSQLF